MRAVERIAQLGLFDFSEVDRLAIDMLGGSADEPPEWAEGQSWQVALSLVYLSAAEAAIVEPFTAGEPPPALPLQEAVRIGLRHARLAALKAGCSPTFWHRSEAGFEEVALYSGDAVKLRLAVTEVAPWAVASFNNIYEAFPRVVERVAERYDGAASPLAQEVANTGLVLIQGLLWMGKLASLLPEAPLQALDEYAVSAGLVSAR
jgi:hypothetical protein